MTMTTVESEVFEIRANGITRTFRDTKTAAVDAGRLLKGRDHSAEVLVVNKKTNAWLSVTDAVMADPKWRSSKEAAN